MTQSTLTPPPTIPTTHRSLVRGLNTRVAKPANVDIARMDRLGLLWGTAANGHIIMSLRDWVAAEKAGAVEVMEGESAL